MLTFLRDLRDVLTGVAPMTPFMVLFAYVWVVWSAKALAARRYGIKTFILPEMNEQDLVELPAEVRAQMTFVPARTLEDVLKVALPAGAAADTAAR